MKWFGARLGRPWVASRLLSFLVVLALAPQASVAQDCYTYGGDQQPRLIDTRLMFGGHIIALDADESHLVAGAGRFLNWCNLDSEGVPVFEDFFDCGGVIRSIVLDGTWVYVAAERSGLIIVDFSDVSAPVVVAQVLSDDISNDLEYSADHIFLADYRAGLRIFDISNRSSPVQLTQLNLPGGNADPMVKYVEVGNGTCWIASGDFIYQVLDISNPAEPQIIDEWVEYYEYQLTEGLLLVDGLLHIGRLSMDWSDPTRPPLPYQHIFTMDVSDP